MRVAISNIAWDVSEDPGVAALLSEHAIDAIDIAPAKYFAEPARARDADVLAVKSWWSDRGIAITGMQALMFGTTGLNLFGSPESRRAMLAHLEVVCRIGALLGAPRLVFGSPKNRDRSSLDDRATRELAFEFFAELATIASAHQVVICLEPNPPRYGSNFMIDSRETAAIVAALAQPSIRMQLDTGALAINGEDPSQVIEQWGEWVGHVHASEPDLVPLGDGDTPHQRIGSLVQSRLPHHVVTIEMLATKTEPHLVSIQRALEVAVRCYRNAVAISA